MIRTIGTSEILLDQHTDDIIHADTFPVERSIGCQKIQVCKPIFSCFRHVMCLWGETDTDPANVVKCVGQEDPDCSDSIPSIGINDAHLRYFGQSTCICSIMYCIKWFYKIILNKQSSHSIRSFAYENAKGRCVSLMLSVLM